MFLPIDLIKVADGDSLAGTGMNEFAVFQVDSYMGGAFLLSSVVKENKVAFAEFPFLHFLAILLSLVIGVSFQFLPIDLIVNGRSQS